MSIKHFCDVCDDEVQQHRCQAKRRLTLNSDDLHPHRHPKVSLEILIEAVVGGDPSRTTLCDVCVERMYAAALQKLRAGPTPRPKPAAAPPRAVPSPQGKH